MEWAQTVYLGQKSPHIVTFIALQCQLSESLVGQVQNRFDRELGHRIEHYIIPLGAAILQQHGQCLSVVHLHTQQIQRLRTTRLIGERGTEKVTRYD
jgi:hypothetical protein